MSASDQPGFGAGNPPNGGFGSQPGAASPIAYPVDGGITSPYKVANWRPLVHWILVIPHWILLYVLNIVAYFAMVVAWFSALFTGAVPDGVAGFLAGVHRYQWRVISYLLFMREDYPAFGLPTGYPDPGGDPAWLSITPPQGLSRLAVLFRIILIIPQALALFVVGIGAYVAVFIAFFAVLFTGRWPEGLRNYVVGVFRWSARVGLWFICLADPYPPFSLS